MRRWIISGLAVAIGWLGAQGAAAQAYCAQAPRPALGDLRPEAMDQLCAALQAHPGTSRTHAILVDFDRSEGAPRLFVLDLSTAAGKVLDGHRTTHGRDSDDGCRFGGENLGPFGTVFGPYATEEPALEADGVRFLPLRGLDDRTRPLEARGMRIAARPYVSGAPTCPEADGKRLPGRSAGGFMVGPTIIDGIIKHLEGRHPVLAYATGPTADWARPTGKRLCAPSLTALAAAAAG